MPPPNKQDAPFFVGYLPMPTALARFYRPLAVLLIAACGVGGYWLAAQQKSTGPATWDNAQVTTMQGVLRLRPYPVLHRISPDKPGEVESVLLVRQGKHSADDWSVPFDRQPVSVSGYAITRGGWTMLEIADEDAFQKAGGVDVGQINASLESVPLGAVSLRGEIADSKCFLGVMKPGAGTIHKACAEVCLLGGIPPMLLATDAHGKQFGYMLARADGSGAAEWLAKFAAEPVQISGKLQRQGGLLFIRMDDDGIRRM